MIDRPSLDPRPVDIITLDDSVNNCFENRDLEKRFDAADYFLKCYYENLFSEDGPGESFFSPLFVVCNSVRDFLQGPEDDENFYFEPP